MVFDGSVKSSNRINLNEAFNTDSSLQQELSSYWDSDVINTLSVRTSDRCIDKFGWRRVIEISRELFGANANASWRGIASLSIDLGISSAPYLAVRCLNELARVERGPYPQAQAAILNDFYVDDLLTETVSKTVTHTLAGTQIRGILASGGFHLHKWASNESAIIADMEAVNQRPRQA